MNTVLTICYPVAEYQQKLVGGIRTAAEIINFMGSSENSVTKLRGFDGSWRKNNRPNDRIEAYGYRRRGIRFSEGNSIRCIDHCAQGCGLGSAGKIFRNMSSRAAKCFGKIWKPWGPVRVSDVEANEANSTGRPAACG